MPRQNVIGPPGLFHHPRAQIFIRHKEQIAILGRGLDNLDRIAAGADDIAKRFHFRAAVDVSDRIEIRVARLKRFQLGRRTAFLQGTARVLVWQNHHFLRIQNLGGFGHEVNPAKDDHLGAGLAACRERPRESPTKSATSWISGT